VADNVGVEVQSVGKFFTNKILTIPDYQRNYVWGKDKVEAFISDIREHGEGKPYYMGSVLLFKKDDSTYEIIDGQQRITTLSILYHVLKGGLPEACEELSYTSEQSRWYIQQAKKLFDENLNHEEKEAWKDLFEQLMFTVIQIPTQDLAFTFFDTQNNRGIPLSAADFLKAYHLRAVEKEPEQKGCAKLWEQSDKLGNQDFGNLESLFRNYLWRGRYWTGRRVDEFESKARILDEFQKKTHQNIGWVQLHSRMRMPIQAGEPFFAYAAQFAEIREVVRKEVKYFLDLHESSFAREFLQLSCMMFYDKFGLLQLDGFAKALEYAIGAVRIKQSRICKQTLRNEFLRDSEQNLFDVIVMAYRPDEVLIYIQSLAWVEEAYANPPVNIENNDVRVRYLSKCDKAGMRDDSARGELIKVKVETNHA